jgi:hypothetical protein
MYASSKTDSGKGRRYREPTYALSQQGVYNLHSIVKATTNTDSVKAKDIESQLMHCHSKEYIIYTAS